MEIKDLSGTCVSFKSRMPYYPMEESGLKPFTVREVDLEDARFRILIAMEMTGKLGKIQINDADNPKEHFEHQITCICFYKNLVMVAWEADFKKEDMVSKQKIRDMIGKCPGHSGRPEAGDCTKCSMNHTATFEYISREFAL